MIEPFPTGDGPPSAQPSSDAPSPLPPSIFTFPNRIVFGAGSLRSLPGELRRLNVARPLVVTDPGLVGSGLADAVLDLLESPVLFTEVQANPTEDDVLAGAERFQASGCDGVIGLGGGSPIDAAKAIRLVLAHPGPLADYDVNRGGIDRIKPDMVPMAAIPTTAGTGSEAGRGALIQIPGTGRKTAVLSPYLLPSVAVCDPDLTLGLPPVLTAGTGMDALTHCLESYLSTTFHPICDGIALEGLRFIFRGLETAVHDRSNHEARTAMMMGALLGGISFHKGLGVVHALSHALGSEGRVHHGTLNAVLLAHALRFNREAAEPRMTELAARVGLGRAGDGPGHLITLVELIMARMPLPRRLGQIDGLERDRISAYARLAMLDHCRLTNPRPCTQANLEELLDRAW
ncbi:MAG: iron-containing alcohol dehydrogenase [Paludisphaera borealis]|uniref:iron-containing alcohol dehydrogenase n=1 Tax=Paludisphaera borealis TaxID=1387353 RepID=UPI00283DCF9B|nr:iron-containing alcohol dehydrogenase [Paludisphaera borealis]MDR3620128.1 iron-containing alcohol dehydrogenase [Paludisphaera borealis]